MPQFALPHLKLHYEIAGSGPPMLLIPGMLSDNASWSVLVPLMSDRFTLIMPDPPGAGRTQPWDAPITLAGFARDLLALSRDLGHDRLHVVGHSMGGLVAMVLAGLAPDHLASITVLGSTPLPSARIPTVFHTLCLIRETGPEDLWLRALFPWLFGDQFFWDRQGVEDALAASLSYPYLQSLEAMKHQTRSLARLDIRSLPERIPVPGLALLAEADALIPPEPNRDALQAMGLRVEVLPDCGHSLHWDAPQLVADRILLHAGALA
ncbi:alpha/beta fold hydrolase [Mesobacterium sp. TK19101]|uniref:Alpha/beta fold hydrolase n=1 Tax=Mesobacterium hydrothermale TaxID=3111907 RepID=A0ABU6HLZ1_9RHOB|nr:alpha/beta fold hydrolase [Mesobacterium sp. TK19101]MEC3862855.1 alpha/beta fold hydrolase [Mesobacterium sp. TK19101]